MMNAGRIFPVLIGICLFFLWGVQGCGKKADPRPSGVLPPGAIADLRATLAPSGVYLRWSVPVVQGGIENYKIQRHEQQRENSSCVDCPREFVMIADVSANDPLLRKEEGKIVGYVDIQVREGFNYAYKIVACDVRRHCGEESNIEEIAISVKGHQRKEGVKNTSQ